MHISEKTQLVNALPKRNVPRSFCSEGEGGGVLRFDLHHQIKSVFFVRRKLGLITPLCLVRPSALGFSNLLPTEVMCDKQRQHANNTNNLHEVFRSYVEASFLFSCFNSSSSQYSIYIALWYFNSTRRFLLHRFRKHLYLSCSLNCTTLTGNVSSR